MIKLADRRYGRALIAVLLSYLLALQPFVLKAAAAAERSVDPFSIICSHSGSGPNNQGHHHNIPPCCTTGACCVGTLVLGFAAAPPTLGPRVAAYIRKGRTAVVFHTSRPKPHDFEARGPPAPV